MRVLFEEHDSGRDRGWAKRYGPYDAIRLYAETAAVGAALQEVFGAPKSTGDSCWRDYVVQSTSSYDFETHMVRVWLKLARKEET